MEDLLCSLCVRRQGQLEATRKTKLHGERGTESGLTSHRRSRDSTGPSRTDDIYAGLTECESILILPYLGMSSLRILDVQI